MKNSSPRMVVPILSLPRGAKRFVAVSVDSCLCILTVWLSYYLRLGEFVALSGNALLAVAISFGIAIPIFFIAGLYRAIFRYSGWPTLRSVAMAVSIYGLLYASIFTAIGVAGVPRTIGIIQPILLLLFVISSRALARLYLGEEYLRILKRKSHSKVLIYGAGEAGRQLVRAMTNSHEMRVVGFLDDDDRLHGHVLNGQPVFNPVNLENLVVALNVSDVLLAMPSISRKRRNTILSQIGAARVAVRTLPSVSDLASGKVAISDLRELDIDDLLGRDPVMPNHTLLSMNIHNKIVMVTGAGGSIGSELCRQIFSVSPKKLILIDHSEYALYSIHQELEEKSNDRDILLVPLLASVRDYRRMREIMYTWSPETVYHAAAYKHVPIVEHNPAEGISNNVLGTLRTAQAAVESGASNFVLISTDKAVRPTNTMGASKRLAEMILQALAVRNSGTNFSMVRFGNVLGSSGSVVPKFRRQIRDGGPITLTHPEVTRYFMTIPEASQLVLQASAMSTGGEVFMLDMGQPVKIMSLARRLIELSGLTVKDEQNPDGDIEIEISGLRPGEKLFEELLIDHNAEPTSHAQIMKARENFIPWAELERELGALETALNVNDVSAIRFIMEKLVTGFAPSDKTTDWVYLEQ
jgi:FlaA1/EpsC-like NDP-sugar epimerase